MRRTNQTTETRRPLDRSEATRQRRASRTRKPLLATGGQKRKSISRPQPPVLVRRGLSGSPEQARTGSRSRRRYDVALGYPGAEIRLPSLPQMHVGWRIISGLFAVALAGLIYFFWTSPMFQVQAAALNGAVRISEADVNTVLGLAGEPVFTINPAEIENDLQIAFPDMAAITVEVSLPATVTVNISERTPVLIWREDGEEMWVDAEGVMFPPRGDPGLLPVLVGDLPFIIEAVDEKESAAAPQRWIDPQMVVDALTLKSYAPEGTEIMYEADHGL
ncbi:MAG: FtsQ-type POTRA domain-containing protein, partial [Chloroflexota bacterium]